MIESIIRFSVKNKLIIGLLVVALIVTGVFSMTKLPVDAVPDITNNQVQIVTSSSSLAPQEVEQFITFPVEKAMANIPDVQKVRSISRFGLSVVTVVFEEDVPIMKARQYVSEQIDIAQQQIPESIGKCEMMPITTGLGEIYQYTLEVDSGYENRYNPMELRTIQDWIVKRQMTGIEGIIEVSSFGGFLKQYEVAIHPLKLQSYGITFSDVYEALKLNNQNTGGSYIEKGKNAFYIRTEGLVQSIADIESIVISSNGKAPSFIRDIAKVGWGSSPRLGAMTMDGKGEVVGGITLMLKGSNTSEAIENVQKRVEEVQKSLPPGVRIVPYLDRSVLVNKAINTVSKNLIEGGLIVIFVLILLLGNWRAGIIVSSVIPLSLLFAFIMMDVFGVSANLMSLGAIDFGIVVDGAVIIVEGVLHLIYTRYIGKKLSQQEMDNVIISTSSSIIGSAAFGVLIIIVVFIPIMTLTGIEGKMFTPMAKTVSFAIIGALLLSITYVPMLSALILKKNISSYRSFADKLVDKMRSIYQPILEKMINIPYAVIGAAVVLLVSAIFIFQSLGGEFIPTLDEGDMAMQVTIEPGSSLSQMIKTTTQAEAILKEHFPEVKHVVSKIGTAEVPTDPMAVEDADVMILLKDRSEWTSADSRAELASLMKAKLELIEDAQFDFTQPIQLRFNELISGAKTDVVVKLYGEDLGELSQQGLKIASIVKRINGAGDVKIEQTEGLPQIMIRFNRAKLAYYHLNIDELNSIIRAAFAGENAGVVYEGERRFDLTVRLDEKFRKDLNLWELFVNTHEGLIPLSEVASVDIEDGPMQVSHEDAKRRIAVGVNIRDRDISSFIDEVKKELGQNLNLLPGYYLEYGGQFENLEAARKRLSIAVPIALALIFILLFFAFKSIKYALLIYATVPLAAIGGVLALVIRDMPFSISAGVGFIALFGVAVLNGIVLISYFNKLKEEGETDLKHIVVKGASARLRPVIMTAAVASLGFLPMAISSSAGAEVQKPLATVVIGGLVTATLLTLIILPVIYYLTERKQMKIKNNIMTIGLFMITVSNLNGQVLTETMALDSMMANNYEIKNNELRTNQFQSDAKVKFSLGNTSASYSYGQINSGLIDGQLQVEQSLGNPLYQVRKAQEAGALASVFQLQELQSIEMKKWMVSSAWHFWLYQSKRIDLLDLQLSRINKHINQLEEKFKLGEVSKVDLSMAEVYRSELIGEVNDEKLKMIVIENQLRVLTLIKGSLIVPDLDLVIIGDRKDSISEIKGSAILAVQKARSEAAISTLKKERARYFPEISLGYFNQSIDHTRGLQGAVFGLSIPLLNRNHQSEVRKAKMEMEIQSNEYKTLEQKLEAKRVELNAALDMRLELINEHDEKWSEQIDLLTNAIEYGFNEGEVNYLKYLQAYGAILKLEMQRLKLINDYNQTYLELNYYLTTLKN